MARKLLILSLCNMLLLCTSILTYDVDNSNINRLKRSTTHGEHCMAICMRGFQRNLEHTVPDINSLQAAQEDPSHFFSRFDPGIFETLCQSFRKLVKCTNKCAEVEVRDWVKKAFVSVAYMCMERFVEFQQDISCIVQVSGSSIKEICIPECLKYKLELKNYRQLHDTYFEMAPDELQSVLSRNCMYLSCFLDCQSPILDKVCGSRAMNLVQSSIVKAFVVTVETIAKQSFVNPFKNESSLSESVWPSSCARIEISIIRTMPPAELSQSSSPEVTHLASSSCYNVLCSNLLFILILLYLLI